MFPQHSPPNPPRLDQYRQQTLPLELRRPVSTFPKTFPYFHFYTFYPPPHFPTTHPPFSTDFCVYDGLDQIIIGVGMVTPRPGVFVEEIKYLLVVATAVEVVLIAVTLSNGLEGEVSLIPSNATRYHKLTYSWTFCTF